MATEKFSIIKERLVGPVPPALERRWAKLMARRERLVKASQSLEDDFERAELRLHSLVPPELKTEAHEAYRIENGKLFQKLCTCLDCQAKLHGVSMSDAVEALARCSALTAESLQEARERAYEHDAAELRSKQLRYLLN